ncbi:hypothetical protein VPH35_096400 [Triticum aestivum]
MDGWVQFSECEVDCCSASSQFTQSRFAPKRASVQQKAPEKFRVHRSHFRLALFYSPVWVKQGEVEFNYTER